MCKLFMRSSYALLMCPRYMNVPLPAPCHVNVAGVRKQSVWGLRIIARTQLSLWHDSANSSIPNGGPSAGTLGSLNWMSFATTLPSRHRLIVQNGLMIGNSRPLLARGVNRNASEAPCLPKAANRWNWLIESLPPWTFLPSPNELDQ